MNHLANRGVKQLARVVTALCFTVTTDNAPVDERAAKICEFKPHITLGDARKAIEEVDNGGKELAA